MMRNASSYRIYIACEDKHNVPIGLKMACLIDLFCTSTIFILQRKLAVHALEAPTTAASSFQASFFLRHVSKRT